MDTLNIAICEDNKDELNRLLSIIHKSTIPTYCTTFTSGEDLLKEYKLDSFDIIFMDIYMNGMTGIDTITAIRKIDPEVLVAFTTTSLDFALESYRLNAIKYIEKPVDEKSVIDMLKLATIKAKNKPSINITVNGENIAIPFHRIIFLEQQGHNLLIHVMNNKIYTIKNKIDKVAEQFDSNTFIRCHKSYLVNLNYIKSLDKDLSIFVMTEGGNVHIRRESMSMSKNAYESFLFNKTREWNHEKQY